jgi:hypothetical protein
VGAQNSFKVPKIQNSPEKIGGEKKDSKGEIEGTYKDLQVFLSVHESMS